MRWNSWFRNSLVAAWALGQSLLSVGCAPQTVAVPLPSPTPSSHEVLPTQPIPLGTAGSETTVTAVPAFPGTPIPAQLEDTSIAVNDGPGNIAWSHKGDLLAYTYGFSLYVVPVGQWHQPSRVFRASLDDGPWDLGSDFLSWSPDDMRIGVTLQKPVAAQSLEGRMAQVDWRPGTFSLMEPDEEALLIDWSTTNRVVAKRRDSGYWVFDVPTGQWQRLLRPGSDQMGAVGFPRWFPDGNLVAGETVDITGSSDKIAFYKVAPDTSLWQPLNIGTVTFFADTGDPVPSPDGRWIAWLEGYVTKEGGVWRMMLYDRKTGTITEAVNNKGNQTEMWKGLAWSPDSRQLAFSAGRGGSYDRTIWVLHLDMAN